MRFWLKRGVEILLLISLLFVFFTLVWRGKTFTLGPLSLSLNRVRNLLVFACFFLGARILLSMHSGAVKTLSARIAILSAMVFVFIIPFHNYIKPARDILGALMVIGILLHLICGGKPRVHISRWIVAPLLGFLALSFLSACFGIDPRYSLRTFLQRDLFNLTLFVLLSVFLFHRERLQALLDILLLSAGFTLVAGMILYFARNTGYFTGTFSWYNTAALYLDLMVPFLLGALFAVRGRARKTGTALLLVLAVACLVLTRSRGGWIASGAALAGILFFVRPRLLIPAGIIAAVGFFLLPNDFTRRIEEVLHFREYKNSSADSPLKFRPSGWKASWSMIRERPVLGAGPGLRSFSRLYPEHKPPGGEEKMVHAHNTLLQIAVETGLPGALLFFLVMLAVAASGLRSFLKEGEQKPLKWAILMAYGALVLHGLVEYTYLPKQSYIFWILVPVLLLPPRAAAGGGASPFPLKLSCCIVTMGVPEMLERCLKSIQGLGGETIVLDGDPRGSSKGTAEKFENVRYAIHPWDGSISRQKNRIMDLARGEWIFLIDSDETAGKSLRKKLPRLIRSAQYDFYKFPRMWLLSEDPPRYVIHEKLYPDFQLRLLRNRPEMRYDLSRKVHHFFPRDTRGRGKKVKNAHLLHFCFVDNDRAAREKRVKQYAEMEGSEMDINRIYLFEDLEYRAGSCEKEF